MTTDKILDLTDQELADLTARVARRVECRELGALANEIANAAVDEVLTTLRDRANNF